LFQTGLPIVYDNEVTVEIHYSDADAARVAGESRLALYLWLDDTCLDAAETCSPVSDYYRDTSNNILRVTICHLSRYGMFGLDWRNQLPVILRD
jgi:hypothetical protein